MKKITKNMTIGEVLMVKPTASVVLAKHGFHCMGCPMSQMETLEQGAKVHGIDVSKLLKELNS